MPSVDKSSEVPGLATSIHDALAKSVEEEFPPKRVYASRDDFLGAAGKLAEEELYIDGVGWIVTSELTGDQRADVIGKQATALQTRSELDLKSYQRAMLIYGLVDPASPVGNRVPFLRPGDVDRMMRIGGSKLQVILDSIERLSAMGRHSELAEGNSEPTPSDEPTFE